MKPIELNMTAFGPYSGSETIDFTKIDGESLFLITGPTGAGKTTIFDAICYALYGESSGNIRSGESLKSDYSSGQEITTVAFRFLLRGREYSISRTPKQEVRKSRGEGFTVKGGDATLNLPNEESPIVGYKKVTEKIQELVGLNARQFRQIMMIPQGSFQEMINSNSGDREEILKTLFDTDIFSELQKSLKERGNFLAGQIRESLVKRDTLLQGVDAPSQSELWSVIEKKNPALEEVLPLLEEEISRLGRDLKSGEAAYKKLDKKRKDAISKRERAIQDNERAERYETLKKRSGELEEQSRFFKNLGEEILKFRSAMEVLPIEREFREVDRKLKEIMVRLETGEENLRVHREKHGELERDLNAAESEEAKNRDRELGEKITEMKRYSDKLAELRVKEGEEKSLRERSDASSEEISKLESDLKQQEEELSELRLALKEASKIKDEVVSLEVTIKEHNDMAEKLTETMNSRKAIDLLQNEIEKLQGKTKELLARNEDLKEARTQAEDKKQKNILANLASSLEANAPCPLCGSREHPHPAPSHGGKDEDSGKLEAIDRELAKNDEDILKFNGDLGKKEGTKAEREKGLKNLKEAIEKFAGERYWGDLSYEEMLSKIESNSKELSEKKASLEKSLKEMADKESRLEKLEQSLKDGESNLKAQSQNYNETIGSLKSIGDLVQSIRSAIPGEFLEVKEMDSLIAKYEEELSESRNKLETLRKSFTASSEKRASLLSERNNIMEQKAALSEELERKRENFKGQVLRKGFAGYEEYSKFKTEEETIEAKEKSLREYENERERTLAQLEVLENGEPIPEKIDLQEFDANIKKIEDEMTDLSEKNTSIKSSLMKNEEILSKVKETSRTMAKLEEEYATMGKLSKTAEGQNEKKLSFERYILTAFLDDIISAANIRLYKMSASRYKLKRSDSVEDRRTSSGLDLMVRDHYTGLDRSVNTLSGGESFKASLAMALGLSDVVQEYSGGVQLDTMFIDEGFGSLDPESLDQAMNCLSGIQKTGRLVGIISHVPELKERIRTQLEVISSNHGSRTNNFG